MTERQTSPDHPEVYAPDEVSPDHESESDGGGVESPAKIIRIGGMVKQLLEEVRQTSLDEKARDQLRDLYENSITELKGALSDDLASELDRLTLDFDESIPSDSQLLVAKAQLVGWLEGLFHGIQATLIAQQHQASQQLEGMRAELPNPHGPQGQPGQPQQQPLQSNSAGGNGYI